MATKENKGGLLTNEQIEKDLETKGRETTTGYSGSQDNGDGGVRALGNELQQRDGAPDPGESEEA